MDRKREVTLPDGTKAQATVVPFHPGVEYWNEYLADDGTALRVKLVATELLRVEDHYDAAGNPVYLLQSVNVVTVSSPDNLRRGGQS